MHGVVTELVMTMKVYNFQKRIGLTVSPADAQNRIADCTASSGIAVKHADHGYSRHVCLCPVLD